MSNISELMRDPLKTSNVYVAGMMVPQMPVGVECYKLNANENQFGPSPMAIKAMELELKKGNLYPGDLMKLLKEKIAEHYKKKVENISIYNGSGAAINAIGDTFINYEDEIIICSPTYMAYAPLPKRFGGKIIEVQAKEGLYTDLNAILAAITDKTKLIFICNPNNPTGTVLEFETLKQFIEVLPKHVICIVDEAYFEWISIPGYKSALQLIEENQVIVFRTFSKIYGMAGCRMGCAFASKEMTDCLMASTNIFYSNRIAAAGAIAAMEDHAFLEKVYQNNKTQREYLMQEMTNMNMQVVPSQTSFIYFEPGCDTSKCLKVLAENRVYIRDFGPKYLRVSIGLPYQNQAFLDAMQIALAQVRREGMVLSYGAN